MDVNSREYAEQQDEIDPLRSFKDEFHLPLHNGPERCIYLCGNSLGLQPKGRVKSMIVLLLLKTFYLITNMNYCRYSKVCS